MIISLIVAMDEDGVIGKDNGLPWRLPADLAWFKRQTLGKPVVMGRKTFEAIGKALPGRKNIVLTREPAWSAPGATVVHDIDTALAAAADDHGSRAPEVMVIGGAAVYRLLLPHAHRIYRTRVHGRFAGDTRFPPIDPRDWLEIAQERREADEKNAHAMTFALLERAAPPLATRM
jgi:dihydrofolate reductase